MRGQWPFTSWYLIAANPLATKTQYKLYEMTDPYVAELVQPNMALNTPQPDPPFVRGLQHCGIVSWCLRYAVWMVTHIHMPHALADVV